MNDKDLKILEQLFEHEINAAVGDAPDRHLPLQIKSKRIAALKKEGFIQEVTFTLDSHIPFIITGWELTHAGRLAYCVFSEDESPA